MKTTDFQPIAASALHGIWCRLLAAGTFMLLV